MIRKRAVSPVGMLVATKVTPFLIANAAAMAKEAPDGATGAQAIADAIAYGVCASFTNPAIAAAVTAALVLPTGGPLIPPPHTIIKAQSTEA